jgi:predicted dehydrogenase
VAVAVTHRAPSRVLITGDAGEIEMRGTLGARGDGAIVVRRGRDPERPLSFAPVNPYEAELADFVRRVSSGARDEDALDDALENLAVLDGLVPTQ